MADLSQQLVPIGIAVESGAEKIVSMGTRITSIGDLIGKATPCETWLPKGMVRLRSDWIVPPKRML